VVLAPLLLVVAFAIWCEDRQNPIFRQTRIGRFGNPFQLLKFRSMRHGSGAQITVSSDPRITKVGQFIRARKLDEMPQLLNVLRGDMSIVGPRPEVPKYVAHYNDEQRRILQVLPGITDYASLTYFDEGAVLATAMDAERTYIQDIMPKKIALNAKFIGDRTVKNYLWIIYLTVRRVLF